MQKVGLLIFPFWTPHFVVWTPHFGWTPRLNYTVNQSEMVSAYTRRFTAYFNIVSLNADRAYSFINSPQLCNVNA